MPSNEEKIVCPVHGKMGFGIACAHLKPGKSYEILYTEGLEEDSICSDKPLWCESCESVRAKNSKKRGWDDFVERFFCFCSSCMESVRRRTKTIVNVEELN